MKYVYNKAWGPYALYDKETDTLFASDVDYRPTAVPPAPKEWFEPERWEPYPLEQNLLVGMTGERQVCLKLLNASEAQWAWELGVVTVMSVHYGINLQLLNILRQGMWALAQSVEQ